MALRRSAWVIGLENVAKTAILELDDVDAKYCMIAIIPSSTDIPSVDPRSMPFR